jgi:dihydroorotate dehydrogenase electron transfer subunit
MKDETCVIVENNNINTNYFLMKIKAGYISTQAKAGNFIMLAASKTSDPLLKRPFGILKAEPPHIWVYYEIVGKGTQLIASLEPNDTINAIGPLGNSFPPLEKKNILMIAGGRGIAPLYFAIKEYSPANTVFLLYGAGSRDDLNLLPELAALPLKKTFLYTDDGSMGRKGFVTADTREIIAGCAIDATISCGPGAMLKNLSLTLPDSGGNNYVSLEALMGCGFGICYSCAVKTVSGDYKKVCSDGPIFKMEEIAW